MLSVFIMAFILSYAFIALSILFSLCQSTFLVKNQAFMISYWSKSFYQSWTELWIFTLHSKQVYGNVKDCKVSKEDYGLFVVSVQNNLLQGSLEFSYHWLLISSKTQIKPYSKSYSNPIEDYHFSLAWFILGLVKSNRKLIFTLYYSN